MMRNGNRKVPFLDLVTPHQELQDELATVFAKALESAAFIGGPMVEEFERDFARFCQVQHCIGVASGTDALRFALIAAGVGSGDIVVTVPNSFIATTEAITQAGARPVFVDIEEVTYNIDPQRLQAYLENECFRDERAGCWRDRTFGQRVVAVVPVHLYGQPADMDAIQRIADRFGLTVIEDACQAHGAEYFSRKDDRWKKAGSMGLAAAFSFYPGKNLGACGEAGAVTTNDPAVAQKIRMLRDHGQAKKYFHDIEGYNGRLDAIQAGILHVKLGHLARWNEARRTAAQRYRELLDDAGLESLAVHEPDWAHSVYHLYVIRVREREELMKRLAEENIATAIHYPIPLHLQKAYRYLRYQPGDFPVAERVSNEIISLPMFPGLSGEQQERVTECVAAFLQPFVPVRVLAAASGD
jgi:dTDP-4-amino-4,6-dideoxygalactose transaminase